MGGEGEGPTHHPPWQRGATAGFQVKEAQVGRPRPGQHRWRNEADVRAGRGNPASGKQFRKVKKLFSENPEFPQLELLAIFYI